MTGHPVEEVREPAEEPPRHVRAHEEKGEQLDHRLHRHRRHQPGLVLGEIEVAGPEQDAEQGEGRGDEDGGVEHVEHGLLAEHHLEGRRHRLQLEGDVGDHPAHQEQGHQGAEGSRLPVAAGDEVGHRGDALLLGDAHQLAQQHRPQESDAGRPQVDGEEFESAIGRESDAAVERPGSAVHGGGEHVDHGAAPPPGEPGGEGLGGGGDEKQEDEVADEDGEKCALGDPAHGGSSGPRSRRVRAISTTTIALHSAKR